MIAEEKSRMVEISAYDGMVIFSGLGREPIVLAAETAERIGYHLCTAAYAADHGVTRTWREEVFGLPMDEPLIDTRQQEGPSARAFPLEEPRSFDAP